MADKHPYVNAPAHLIQAINQFRRSLPSPVNADTLRKLGIASQNESYVINVIRFLGLIDEEGNRTDQAAKVFSLHDDAEFEKEFSKLIARSYKSLFDLHGESAWDLDKDRLITFFRSADQTTEPVGKRQASTFQVLAGLSGHTKSPEAKPVPSKTSAGPSKKPSRARKTVGDEVPASVKSSQEKNDRDRLGLTVRIEINLPADGDKETYDRIFKSIKENLLSE